MGAQWFDQDVRQNGSAIFWPLPLRTMISRRSRSMSSTRNCSASSRRRPAPYRTAQTSQTGPSVGPAGCALPRTLCRTLVRSSPPCHPGAVGARSTAKREVEGVLAHECAHVERVIGVGAGPPSSRGQRDSHPCRCQHGAWRTIAPVRPRGVRSDGGARPLRAAPRSCPCSAAERLSARARLCPEKDGSVPCDNRQSTTSEFAGDGAHRER